MKYIISLALILGGFVGFSQSPLEDDLDQLNFGIGYFLEGIPFYVGYDVAVHDDITVGLNGNVRFFQESGDTADYDHFIWGFMFNGNYHFNTALNLDNKKWDAYAGLNVGFYKWSSPEDYVIIETDNTGIGAGAQLGGRYYFSNWAVNLEVQGGMELIGVMLGASYKFD